MNSPKAIRNLVIGLFVGFFVAGGVAIFVAIRLDRAKQAQIESVTAKNRLEIDNMVKENARKINELVSEHARLSDSLDVVIAKQEVKIDRLGVTIQRLNHEQTLLAAEISTLRVDRDSTLQNIKID